MSRRWLGWALLLYGVAGLVLIVGGAFAGLEAATRVEELASSASGTLDAAADSTRAAADAFGNVEGSLDESRASADAAADLARDASATLGSLGRAMELSIFGAQPLLQLADDFADSASQASALAVTLDSVAASLNETRSDVTLIGRELDTLAAELGALRDASGSEEEPPPVRALVLLLVAWLLVPALGGIVGGAVLLRLPTAAPAVP